MPPSGRGIEPAELHGFRSRGSARDVQASHLRADLGCGHSSASSAAHRVPSRNRRCRSSAEGRGGGPTEDNRSAIALRNRWPPGARLGGASRVDLVTQRFARRDSSARRRWCVGPSAPLFLYVGEASRPRNSSSEPVEKAPRRPLLRPRAIAQWEQERLGATPNVG
jgi:hypothetical protein